jgi:hypothetical protein
LSSHRPKRRKSRAGRRGSLVVEMVVVTPLLAMLCGFAFWFHQFHQAQMTVYRDVREPTWQTALAACGNPGPTSGSYTSGGSSVTGGGPVVIPGANWTNVYRYVPGTPNVEVITRSIPDTNKDATRTLSGHDVPGILRISSSTYQAQARMMCNETVQDGQPDPMKRIAHVTVKP